MGICRNICKSMYTNHNLVNIYRFLCSIAWEETTVSWEGEKEGERRRWKLAWRTVRIADVGIAKPYSSLEANLCTLSPAQTEVTLHVPSNCAYRNCVPSLRPSGSSMEKPCLHSVSRYNAQHLVAPNCLKMRLRKHMINFLKVWLVRVIWGNQQVILQGSFSGTTPILLNESFSEGA